MQSSEWILVGSFLIIFCSLVLLTTYHSVKARSWIELKQHQKIDPISLTIEGAVAKPGTYQIIPGTSLKQVIKKSRPKPNANLRGLDLEKRIERDETLLVKELEEVIIRLEGEVAGCGDRPFPYGTRICDLKGKISLTEEADSQFLKSRRRLKDGEILVVPKKPL